MAATRLRVVVIGGGFAGLQAVRHLRGADCDVTLVDRRNHHLFQPLLYQVATGSLSPGEIAVPLRWVLRRQRNVRVVLAGVEEIDVAARTVRAVAPEGGEVVLPYDVLVVAPGSETSFFGHDAWEADAPGLKTIEDATRIRAAILTAFEQAELEPDAERRAAWLTFVVVGGGPTGVELAGQIAELARDTLRHDFRAIDPRTARVLLLDAGPRLLTSYDARLSRRAAEALAGLGVEVRLGAGVTAVDGLGVAIGDERIASRTVLWAAGVHASPLGRLLATATGVEIDRGGRLRVEPDLTLPGHPELVVAGDLAALDGVPAIAPAAMQQGRHAAAIVRDRLAGGAGVGPFRYRDKGSIATIGRNRAVAEIGGRRLWGYPAWALWLGVHLAYLVGFQNRVLVLLRWSNAWWTRGRGARLITGGHVHG